MDMLKTCFFNWQNAPSINKTYIAAKGDSNKRHFCHFPLRHAKQNQNFRRVFLCVGVCIPEEVANVFLMKS